MVFSNLQNSLTDFKINTCPCNSGLQGLGSNFQHNYKGQTGLFRLSLHQAKTQGHKTFTDQSSFAPCPFTLAIPTTWGNRNAIAEHLFLQVSWTRARPSLFYPMHSPSPGRLHSTHSARRCLHLWCTPCLLNALWEGSPDLWSVSQTCCTWTGCFARKGGSQVFKGPLKTQTGPSSHVWSGQEVVPQGRWAGRRPSGWFGKHRDMDVLLTVASSKARTMNPGS